MLIRKEMCFYMNDNSVFSNNRAETAETRVSQMLSVMRVVYVGVCRFMNYHFPCNTTCSIQRARV